MKLREARRIVHQVGGQELQRDRLSEPEIVGAVDLAHAAAPERRDDAVTVGEEVPGAKRPQSVPLLDPSVAAEGASSPVRRVCESIGSWCPPSDGRSAYFVCDCA